MNKKLLIVLFAIAAAIRIWGIWQAPLWYDENFTLILSRLPFGRMMQAIYGDVHPPLWYLIEWPLGQLHVSPWMLRIPSVLLSLAALWAFWKVTERLCSPRVQVAALILMAVMPMQLYYAQEARMYALLEFLILAGLLALLEHRWAWFTVCGIGMIYTQNYGLFYFATLCLAGLLIDRSTWRKVILCGTVTGFAYLPWIPVLLGQMSTIHGNYWMHMSSVGTVLLTIFQVILLPPGNAVIQIPLMLVGFGWLFVAVIYAIVKKLPHRIEIFVLAFLPFVLSGMISMIWQPIIHYRPLIGTAPFLYILLAGPVDWFFAEGRFNFKAAIYASIFLLPVLIISDITIYRYATSNKSTDGTMTALSYVLAHWQPGDIIYATGDNYWVDLKPYAPEIPEYLLPNCGEYKGALSDQTRQAIGMEVVPLDQIHFTRAWVLWGDTPLSPACTKTDLEKYGFDIAHPVLVTIDNEYIFSGVWMIEGK